MTPTWNVNLTSHPLPEGTVLDTLTEDVLTRLLDDPRSAAAVVSADAVERTISPMFDVEAATVEEAVAIAVAVFRDVMGSTGLRAVVSAVEVAPVAEHAAV